MAFSFTISFFSTYPLLNFPFSFLFSSSSSSSHCLQLKMQNSRDELLCIRYRSKKKSKNNGKKDPNNHNQNNCINKRTSFYDFFWSFLFSLSCLVCLLYSELVLGYGDAGIILQPHFPIFYFFFVILMYFVSWVFLLGSFCFASYHLQPISGHLNSTFLHLVCVLIPISCYNFVEQDRGYFLFVTV